MNDDRITPRVWRDAALDLVFTLAIAALVIGCWAALGWLLAGHL